MDFDLNAFNAGRVIAINTPTFNLLKSIQKQYEEAGFKFTVSELVHLLLHDAIEARIEEGNITIINENEGGK